MSLHATATVQKKGNDLKGLFVPPEKMHEQMRSVFDRISQRAHEIFEERGGAHGHDQDDWFQAESATLESVHHEVSDSGDAFVVVIDVSSFAPQNLRVSAEEQSLKVFGTVEPDDAAAYGFLEPSARWRAFYLSWELPAPIDLKKEPSAIIREDLLELRLPKSTASQDKFD
jgi:HSP20 family molecular chaperone IbpA